MRLNRQLLLLVPIMLVGAMLAAIALLPRPEADAALWWHRRVGAIDRRLSRSRAAVAASSASPPRRRP